MERKNVAVKSGATRQEAEASKKKNGCAGKKRGWDQEESSREMLASE